MRSATTNRTHLRDFLTAVTDSTALLLKVHTSNFAIVGFTAETTIAEMATLGSDTGIPVMLDAGSGCLIDLSPYGICGEPTIRDYLDDGADVVTFSGDKLLGGPQAGIIAGKRNSSGADETPPVAAGCADRQTHPGRPGGYAQAVSRRKAGIGCHPYLAYADDIRG